MTQYTYSRGTDGCDNTFDIYDPAGEFLTSIHYWEREAGAEADARLIVHRLNCHERLLAACKAVVDRWEKGDLAEAARMCQEAIAEADGDA